MNDNTDIELIQRTLNGETDAFGELVRRYQDAVYATALHRIGNFTDAQDVAQETFIEAYKNLHKLRDPARFPGWLHTITLRQCSRWMRRRHETIPIEDLDEPQMLEVSKGKVPLPDESLERKELQEIVLGAIASLPPKVGKVVTMYYIDGLSYEEIASFLSIPKTTVKGRLQMGRRRLKEELIAMVEDILKRNRPDDRFSEEVRVKLERMLESEDAVLRRKAVHQLQEYHKEDETVEDLIIEATKDDNRDVRSRAVYTLGWIRCERAIPTLVECLKDPDPQVRKRAAWSLNRIGTEKVLDEVLKLLDHPDEVIRRHALDASRGICTERTVPRLVRALHEDEDVGVRERIVHILSEVKGDVVAQELAQLLWDDEGNIRKAAMDALRKMRPASITPILMKGLDDENPKVQCRAIELLGMLNYRDAVSKLIQKLNNPDPDIAFRAAEALGRMRSERALEPLMSFLRDHERMRRRTSTHTPVGAGVVKALGLIGGKTVVPAVLEYFEHLISLESPSIFGLLIATVQTLGRIGDEQVAHRLGQYLLKISLSGEVNLLNWPCHLIRPIIRALGQIGSPVAITYLSRLVDYPYFIGEEAIQALGRLGPDAVQILNQVLARSESRDKRWRAARALGEIGDPSCLEPLKEVLKDDDSAIRYHTVIALGELGDRRAIPLLKEMLNDENYGVRKEALKALKRLGVPESELPQIPSKPKGKRRGSKGKEVPFERFKDERGKLRLPTKDSLRRAVLEKFVKENFEIGRIYQEKEVNEIIKRIYDDHCSVRRYLVDYGMMSRDKGRYWVLPG